MGDFMGGLMGFLIGFDKGFSGIWRDFNGSQWDIFRFDGI